MNQQVNRIAARMQIFIRRLVEWLPERKEGGGEGEEEGALAAAELPLPKAIHLTQVDVVAAAVETRCKYRLCSPRLPATPATPATPTPTPAAPSAAGKAT